MGLTHNSKLADTEPKWSDWIEKNRKYLPFKAFAYGDPAKKSTWKYPHHWVVGGYDNNGDGIWDEGDMYLHKGGLDSAWKYANGARTGEKAPEEVLEHLRKHYKALGIEKEEDFLKPYLQFLDRDDETKVVKGVVYSAGYIDSDGETMDAITVRKMAWDFLSKGKIDNIDINHNWLPSGCMVVESYFLEKSDGIFPDNSWIIAVRCTDEVWDKVKKGELNGFSLGGYAEKSNKKVLVELAKTVVGKTDTNSNEDLIPPHGHDFVVYFDDKNEIIKGVTTEVLGHRHVISKATITDDELNHTHKYSLSEIGG